MIDKILLRPAQQTNDFLRDYFASKRTRAPKRAQTLIDALEYSLFTGGKRFRAALTILSAEALGVGSARTIPYAAALELIHNYSLIHDDLPALDDDHTRRGQPSNHCVYGEALAIMAGDALLTEAWKLITQNYKHVPDIATELVDILAEASGSTGMIAGQVMDLDVQHKLLQSSVSPLGADELSTLHRLKTAALMRAATEGAAILARAQDNVREQMRSFGESLGFCFQIADDIHDFNPKKPEDTGFPKLIGIPKTRELLEEESAKALQAISHLGARGERLRELVEFNLRRIH